MTKEMEGANEPGGRATGLETIERKRVVAVVETLANLHSRGETLAEVAHDARNMVTALGLYCDLLEEPGVLAAPFSHYGSELRLVASASRRLVEKLVTLDSNSTPTSLLPGTDPSRLELAPLPRPTAGPDWLESTAMDSSKADRALLTRARADRSRQERANRWDLMPAEPVANLASELLANRNLLAALVGPAIALTVDVEGGARPVRMTGEDLTRILVNLVKNAAEAMPSGGRIQLGLRERHAAAGTAQSMSLTIEDSGPGIPKPALDKIFDSGFTTHTGDEAVNGGWQGGHRGLGLAITRSIVEAAGGRVSAANRARKGARIEIELPVRAR